MVNKPYKSLIIIVIIAIIMVAIALFSVQKQEKEGVKIGYIGVLSGPVATQWGFHARDAAEMAVEEINNKGNIKLQLIWGDSAAKPDQGITEFRRISELYNPDVFIVDASGVASAIAPLVNEYKTPIVFGSVALPGITKSSEYLFRNFYVCDQSAPLLAENIFKKLNIKKVSILSQSDPYGQSCSEYFTNSFTALGGKITTEERFMLTDFDFRTQLTKMADADAEAIYIIGYSKQIIEIIKEINELKINKIILAELVLYSPEIRQEVIDMTNPPEVYLTVTPFYLGLDKANNFKQKYKEEYGKEPSYVAAYIYDTIYLIAESVDISSKEGIDLREALAKSKIVGIRGQIEFDENRETTVEIYFVKLNKEGSLSVVN